MKGQDTPSNDHPQSALVAFFFRKTPCMFNHDILFVPPRNRCHASFRGSCLKSLDTSFYAIAGSWVLDAPR